MKRIFLVLNGFREYSHMVKDDRSKNKTKQETWSVKLCGSMYKYGVHHQITKK